MAHSTPRTSSLGNGCCCPHPLAILQVPQTRRRQQVVGRHSVQRREKPHGQWEREMLHWAIPIKLGMARAFIFDGYTLREG